MNDLNLRFERPPQKQLKRFLKTQQQKRDYDEAMDFGEHECREAYLGKPLIRRPVQISEGLRPEKRPEIFSVTVRSIFRTNGTTGVFENLKNPGTILG